MTANEFQVRYASGKTATFNTTDADVAAFCNSHFGRGIDPAEFGASVVMKGGDEAAGAHQAEESSAAHAPADPQGDVATDTPKAKKSKK